MNPSSKRRKKAVIGDTWTGTEDLARIGNGAGVICAGAAGGADSDATPLSTEPSAAAAVRGGGTPGDVAAPVLGRDEGNWV